MIAKAYANYRERGADTHPARPKATSFRAAHSHEALIDCLCVWDTVGSLGIPTSGPAGMISRRRHAFHDVKLSSHVLNGFHALAIDERRKPFAPALWEIPEDDPALRTGRWRVEQRWFAGVHSNVGGGYPDRGLSHLALRWIVEKAGECGLAFQKGFVEAIEPECRCAGARRESMTLLYRLLGEHRRPIGKRRVDDAQRELRTFEDVDSSAAERCTLADLADIDRAAGYRPPNLREYWDENPTKWEKYRRPWA
jgi:uncharacterized protein (DUF2235 family)